MKIIVSDIQKLSAEELLEISGGREMRKPFMTQIKTDKKFKDSNDQKDEEKILSRNEELSNQI